jgi:hypothetical protein
MIMKKTIKKKTMIYSIGVATIFVMVSFTSVVGFQMVNSSQKNPNSPLYSLRLGKLINPEKSSSLSPIYIGKDKDVEIPLPTRELLTGDILSQLSSDKIREQILLGGSDLTSKWENILSIGKNNLDEMNSIIRQDYSEFQSLVAQYCTLSTQQAKDQFFEMIREFDTEELKDIPTTPILYDRGNITSGPLCNITSGQFCQITTQPICQITTQPICSITKGFVCWTIFGPLCPTAGIKCHPPTSRPKLCSFFATAGKILKSLVLILILAAVIFVPLGLLTLVLVTVLNPDRCTQIHDRITTWFNCTTPG